MIYKYNVETTKMITKNVLNLRLRAQTQKDIFSFRPGQYVALSFYKNDRPSPLRCFSIVSAPSQKGMLDFGIRIGGAFTGELAQLKINDEIVVMGPYGELTINPAKISQAVLIAGGIGITPFLSMIREGTIRNWPTKIKLLYSARNGAETAYATELITYYKKNPNFSPYFFLTDEPTISTDKIIINGPITAEQIEKVVEGNFINQTFYLCGPPGMMTAMRKTLLAKKVRPEKILSEEFSSSGIKGSKTPQTKINFYAMAAVIIGFIIIMVGDIGKNQNKLAAMVITTPIQSGVPSASHSIVSNIAQEFKLQNTPRPTPTSRPLLPKVSKPIVQPAPIRASKPISRPITGVS